MVSAAPAAPAPPRPARPGDIVVTPLAVEQARALRPDILQGDDDVRDLVVSMVRVAALGGKVETGEAQLFAPLGCPRWAWAIVEGTAAGTTVVSVVASLRAPPAPPSAGFDVAEAVALLRRIRDASGDRIVSRNAARLLDSIENPSTGGRA